MLALNSDRYLEYIMGVWWGGGVLNPVNVRWSVPEIVYSLDDCATAILIVDEHFAGARRRHPQYRSPGATIHLRRGG